MKYARFITTISLLFAFVQAQACVAPYYSPSEYYLFHFVDLPDYAPENFNLYGNENCLLWQQQTSTSIPLEDIYHLVYKSDLELLTELKSGRLLEEVKENQMAQWLVDHNDQEAIDFLILAKNCEWLRRESLSPWYYPSKEDPVRYSLNDIAELAKQKTAGRFADRYALQAVRAMTSLQQYEEIIGFWDKIEGHISEGFLRQMMLSYVAGAYAHLDNLEEAKRYFIAANDLNGLLECDQRYNGNMSRVERMELLYENYPDCPTFRLNLWEILGHIEPDRQWDDEDSWYWNWDKEKAEISQLAALCDKVLEGDSRADKALWAYAATYIAHLQGDDKKADRYLKTAEKNVKDQNLVDVIKVMRMYIDAQICTYDKAYEQKLFTQLRWLQGMVETHIDDEVIASTSSLYELQINCSYYYWNDAMRCILLGTVCPKMIKAGKTTLALQLANMSGYTLLNEVNQIDVNMWSPMDVAKYGSRASFTLDQYRHSGLFNSYDYSSCFAEIMDTLSANALMAYVQIVEKPQTQFQKFLNAHSYNDLDFLNEMVGTHCLREMRYADAERYLSKVSAEYFLCTNVYKEGYLNRDPFSLGLKQWSHGVEAKFRFAKTMNLLEHEIAATADPNRKALLMIDFGIGLRNSFDYCWALTQYRQGEGYYYDLDEHNRSCIQEAMERVGRLFEEAFASLTNNEYAAQAQLLFSNYKTVKEQYPETIAAERVRGRCDQFTDYHAEKKRFAYLGEYN